MFIVEDVLPLVMVVVGLVSVTLYRETYFAVEPWLGASQTNATLIVTLYQSWAIVAM